MTYLLNFSTNLEHSFVHIVNGIQYKIHIHYNQYLKSYYMNLDKYTTEGFVNILNSCILTTGADLLKQYEYLNLGKLMLIPIKQNQWDKLPDTETLKGDYILLWEHD